MTKDLFPPNTKEEIKNKILSLATTVYNKEASELTKSQLENLMLMDMKSSINKITVSTGATRPAGIQYASNNYHISAEVDVSGMFDIVREIASSVPQDKLLETYFDAKAAAYKMIEVKYASTEQYLHGLLDTAMKKDGVAILGRNNKE
jgi:hypothetical protein